jgi:hypothetical protein
MLIGFELLTISPSAHINSLWLVLKEGKACKTLGTIVDDV